MPTHNEADLPLIPIDGVQNAWRMFWTSQRLRLKMRWWIVRSGILSGAFWTVLLILWGRAPEQFGPGAIAVILGVWTGLALPALLFQIAVAIDLLNYFLAGRPVLTVHMVGPEKRTRSGQPPSPPATLPLWARVAISAARWAGSVSPLAPLSVWGLFVLIRRGENEWSPAVVSRVVSALRPTLRRGEFVIVSHIATHQPIFG